MTVRAPKRTNRSRAARAEHPQHFINQHFHEAVENVAGRDIKFGATRRVKDERAESAKQKTFFLDTGIVCGPQERLALEELSCKGFSFPLLRKLKVLDHLIWDKHQSRHFVRLVGGREAVVASVLLLYVCLCLVLLAYIALEEWWGRASSTHYAWSAGSGLAALGFMVLLYNLLWVPLHEGLPVKRALAKMHGDDATE